MYIYVYLLYMTLSKLDFFFHFYVRPFFALCSPGSHSALWYCIHLYHGHLKDMMVFSQPATLHELVLCG